MPITSPDPRYVPLGPIQQVFFDKLYDEPMSAGVLTFFHDNQRTIPKNVYKLSGNPGSYQYVDIGNTITLSNIGAVNDSLGNNIQCFLFPYIEAGLPGAGNIDLYYIVCENSGNQFQFSSEAQPFLGESAAPESTFGLQNFIPNSQFLLGQLAAPGTISATVTNVAYGNWQYIRSSNASTDTVTFPRFTAPLNGIPSGNPRYACRIACSSPSAGDTYKTLQIVFQDVNRFSDPNQQLTLFFSGLNNQTGLLQLNVSLYKYFGVGGSVPTTTPIGSYAFSNTGYTDTVLPFFFGSNYGKTLGSGNDDYFAIQIELPPTLTFDISLTDFCLYLGNVDITAFPFTTDPIGPNINVKKFTSSGTYTPSNCMSYCTIECWGGGGPGGYCAGALGASYAGSGGGSGGYSRKTVSNNVIGASQVVTVGAAGVASSTSPTNGGNTSVGSICIANGGAYAQPSGAGYGTVTNPGSGGAPGTGDIAAPGMSGSFPNNPSPSVVNYVYGGYGGSTLVGEPGIQIMGSGGPGNGITGIGYGAGGGGAICPNTESVANGGNGAPGLVIITEYIPT